MARSPAFQFYPADFLVDENVVVMPLDALGAYIKTMCYCWREGSIPSQPDRLSRLCNISADEMARLIGWLKPCYRPMDSDPMRWVHPRLESERRKQSERHDRAVADGRAGAQVRWQCDDRNNSHPIGRLPKPYKGAHSSSSSSASSPSGIEDTPATKVADATAGSEESIDGAEALTDDAIYQAYPRHKEPAAAKGAIARAVSAIRKGGVPNPRAWLLQRTRMYADARKKLLAEEPGSDQFTPYPQKWFNKGCYNEDPAQWLAEGRSAKRKLPPIDPVKADRQQREDKIKASDALRSKQRHEEDIAQKIAALRALSAEEISALKASVVADQPENRRQDASSSDPFGGAGMTVLMYAKLMAPKLAESNNGRAA